MPAAVTTDKESELHAFLAAYYAALAALKAPPPPPQTAGLNAFVYWTEHFANPENLFPEDTPFVRGRIWS